MFANSGAEADENAVKIAKGATRDQTSLFSQVLSTVEQFLQ